jgi:serine/threonine protein kinase/Flp pilus assembly protein TadD
MNEEPTVPIGVVSGDAAERPEAPPVSAAWGSFTLLARVGYGGFGEVYRAWDPHLQREVALKLLLPGAVGGEAEYEAMLREARALASVRHPNIVPVHGIDRQQGRVGFWTDFVRGRTLAALVNEQGTFGAREAALIGLDITRALSAVHRAGLLHRDIKAENVMREEGGRILLMDFGLSAIEHRPTNIAGTPNYMAPELFTGGQSTVATDIYAMGVLLYYLVAGDYPAHLHGMTTKEAQAALSNRKPLMDLRPDLPETLLQTVSAAMNLDPAKRFSSAGQLASALAESLGTHAPPEISSVPDPHPGGKRRRAWWMAGVGVAVAMAVGFAAWPGNLQRLMHRSGGLNVGLSGTTEDVFEKAQGLLLRSYKEANLADAVKRFEAVLKAEPDSALAEARLGLAHLIQYRYSGDAKLLDLAKQETDRAIQLEPDLADPYITRSRISAMEGKTQAATEQAKKALDLNPRSAEAYGALGEVYEAEGRDKDALEAYQNASERAPDDWRWPVSLGAAEFGQGNIPASLTALQRGVELAPDNATAYYDLSIVHTEAGQLDEARKDLDESLALEPTDRSYSALGSLLMNEGKYDEAIKAFKKAIQLKPNNYVPQANLGDAYNRSGAKNEAMEAYRKSIELEETEHEKKRQDPVLLVTLAHAYAEIGNAAKSLPLTRQAMALAENNPLVEFIGGETYEILGQREKAVPLIARALANGYSAYELTSNPELAALRADPKFNAELNAAKAKKK